MAQLIIDKINTFVTFKYDRNNNKVINLKTNRDLEIDEFLEIQYILDCNQVQYNFEKNFEIQILN